MDKSSWSNEFFSNIKMNNFRIHFLGKENLCKEFKKGYVKIRMVLPYNFCMLSSINKYFEFEKSHKIIYNKVIKKTEKAIKDMALPGDDFEMFDAMLEIYSVPDNDSGLTENLERTIFIILLNPEIEYYETKGSNFGGPQTLGIIGHRY